MKGLKEHSEISTRMVSDREGLLKGLEEHTGGNESAAER